jgi:cytochrome c oxidase assembly protein subunit 15
MKSYDQKVNKLFYYWLLISFAMIFTIIVVGGLTRLTNSGLSITEWELFKGVLPPLNNLKWNEYFSLYKTIPQYELVNFDMTLNEFKVIFYWEYFHRILGRLLGLFFLMPLIFFFIVKKKEHLSTCFIILLLIIFQGVIGWYMVKSGLVNNITVSHYRLSLHLTTAIIIISSIFWILLNLRKKTNNSFFTNVKKHYFFYFLFFLIFFQIIFGAFVSGLDAGQLYQTWPLMNYSYFPDDVLLGTVKDFFNFNDHGLVQFYHRNLAYIICVYIVIIGFYIYRNNVNRLIKPFYYVMCILILQIILGVTTLISGLNIYLASAHQICGLLLILSIINMYYEYIN